MIIHKGNQSAPMGYHNGIPIWDGVKQTIDPFAEYIWFDCGSKSGTVNVITPNSGWDGYNSNYILSLVDDVVVNNTSIGPVKTTSISQGDIIRVKFSVPYGIPHCAFFGADVKNILHWPETGNPVIIGYNYLSGAPGSCFRGCNLVSIADAVDGFGDIANDALYGSGTTGVMTLTPQCTFIGKYAFYNFGNSGFVVNYKAQIDESKRDSYWSYYPWNSGSTLKLYIDNSANYIPKYTFKNNLQVYIKNPTPPTLSSTGNDSATIHVPTDLVSTYQAAWSGLTVVGDYND